jgi:lipase
VTHRAEPTEHRISANGIEQAYFEWNADARGRGPTFVMAHATGFHARCWDQIVRKLGNRHVIAVDMRGHGRSAHLRIEHWEVFGDDLAALIVELGLDQIFGVGHSMGGHAMVEAAAILPEKFIGMVLYDPVIGEPSSYEGNEAGHWARYSDAGHPVARRRGEFESPEAMIERFVDRPPYAHFEPPVLRDYCEYGLLRDEEKACFVLACPPAVEASIYMTSRSNGRVLKSARKVHVPVLILRAKVQEDMDQPFEFSLSPTWPGFAGEFSNARDLHFPKATHFMPFEDSTAIAQLILEHLDFVLHEQQAARNP